MPKMDAPSPAETDDQWQAHTHSLHPVSQTTNDMTAHGCQVSQQCFLVHAFCRCTAVREREQVMERFVTINQAQTNAETSLP